MRSIDADAIYDTLSDIFIEYLATSSNTDTRNALDSLYHTVLSAVETVPTISPDDVGGAGKWIGSMAGLRCSICNEPLGLMVGAKNYCPSCGARMKGVSEDA